MANAATQMAVSSQECAQGRRGQQNQNGYGVEGGAVHGMRLREQLQSSMSREPVYGRRTT